MYVCVPLQIAALTGQDPARVVDDFDRNCYKWREVGVSSNSILGYAKAKDFSAYCF